jgi:hypothetical protein
VPSRPSDNYLQDGASPFLYPGLNVRENAVKDYAEDLASETEASVKVSNYTLAVADKATEGRQTPPAGRQHRRPLLRKRAAGVAGSIGACAIHLPQSCHPLGDAALEAA